MTEYINKDFYKQIPANERHFIKLPQEVAYAAVKELEAADIPYSATVSEYRSIVTVNKADSSRAEEIARKYASERSDRGTIIGNTEYKYIRDKKYIDTDADTARKIAALLSGNANNKFSGIIRGEKATITVSGDKNAAAVRAMVDNIKNLDLLEALRERGFERTTDTNGFVNIRNIRTGETCGFNSMSAVRDMFDDTENEFFYPLSYRIAYREHPTNGDYFYYIQKYSSVDRSSAKVFRDENNKPPIFKSIDETLSYTADNGIEITNIDEEIANWREVDREREDNSIIEENRKLIENFPISSGDYIDLISYDPNNDTFSWVYFNPDGNEGEGEFIDKTIAKEDIFAAYSVRIAAEGQQQGRNNFIAYLNENCKENVIELHSGYFAEYADDYINYASRNYNYFFGISENSTATMSVDSFISSLEANCDEVTKDKQQREHPQEITADSFRVELDGYSGAWNVIENAEIDGRELFMLENDYYGDSAAYIIADKDGNIVDDNVWGDFEEYENTLVKCRLIEAAENSKGGTTMPVLKEFAEDMKKYGFNVDETDSGFTAKGEDVAGFIRMDTIGEILYDISEKYRFEPNEVGNNHLLDLNRFYDSYEWNGFSAMKNVIGNTIAALKSGNFEPVENYIEQVKSVCENSGSNMPYEESKINEAAENLAKVKAVFIERNKSVLETEEAFPNGELSEQETAVILQKSNIRFGSLGNGVICYDISRLDKETGDYLNVAHISNEGKIRYYIDDLSEDDRQSIENHAKGVKDRFTDYWNGLPLHTRYGMLYDKLLETGSSEQIKAFNADHSSSEISDKVKKYERCLIFMDEDFPFYNSPAKDFETELNALVSEKNKEAVKKIEVGSEVTLHNDIYSVKLIDGDFMMSMEKKSGNDVDIKQYAGNWKEQLVNEAGNDPLFVYSVALAKKLDSSTPEISEDNVTDNVNDVTFDIYQVKSGDEYIYKRFVDLSALGGSPNISDYDLVYSGSLSESDITAENTDEILDGLYGKFNVHRPEDFKGHSLSVSDIIVLRKDGIDTAHYVDDIGFKDVPEFLREKAKELPHNSPMGNSNKKAEEAVNVQKPEKFPNTIAHRNFNKLKKLFPDFMEKNHTYERYESSVFEPLSAEWIGGNMISLMQTYVQNGDLMYDPDVVLKVDFENETVNVVSLENTGLDIYQEYPDGSKGQNDTNSLVVEWLNNIEMQDQKLAIFDDINGNRVDLSEKSEDMTEDENTKDISEKSEQETLTEGKAYIYSEIKFETGEVYLVPGKISDDNITETEAYKEILELYADRDNIENLDDMLRVNIRNFRYGSGEESIPNDTEMVFIRNNSIDVINNSAEIGTTEFFAHFWKNVDDVLNELKSNAAEQHKTSPHLGDGYEYRTYLFPSDYSSDYPDYNEAVTDIKIGNEWLETEEAVKNMNAQGNTDISQIEALRVRTVSFDGIVRSEDISPEAFHIILDRTDKNKDKLKEAAEIYEKSRGNIMPVYTKTPTEATEAGEREIYFANKRENERCAASINYSIGCNNDGMHFHSDRAISDLLNTYLIDRIALIIAARVSSAGEWDKRFSRTNAQWAKDVIQAYPAEQVDAISRLGLNSHSVLLNSAADELRNNYEMFRSMQNEKEVKADVHGQRDMGSDAENRTYNSPMGNSGNEAEDVDNVQNPTEQNDKAKLTELQKQAVEIVKKYEDLPMQDKINIIAQAFGCTTGKIVTTPCRGKWRGTSDISLVFDNGASLGLGNRLTPKAKTVKVQKECINSALVSYNPEIIKLTKETALSALKKRESKDNEFAAEKGIKPYTLLNVEFNDATNDESSYLGWYYVTLEVDGKIHAHMDTHLNYEISDGKVSETPKDDPYHAAGAIKDTDVDYVFNNAGFSTTSGLYSVSIGSDVRERAEKTLGELTRLQENIYSGNSENDSSDEKTEYTDETITSRDNFPVGNYTPHINDIIENDDGVYQIADLTEKYVTLLETDTLIPNETIIPITDFYKILESAMGMGNLFGMLPEAYRDNKLYGNSTKDTSCTPIEETDLRQQLAEAIKNIKGTYRSAEIKVEPKNEDIIPAPANSRKFSFYELDGNIYYREANDTMHKVNASKDAFNRAIGMIKIRDNVHELLNLQLENTSGGFDNEIADCRKRLNDLYDSFVKKYGNISAPKNAKAFKGDNGYFLLAALENKDESGKVIGKADIFTKNTLKPKIIAAHVETAEEALILSVSEKGKVDFDFMTELCGMDKGRLISELDGQIYKLPQETEKYVTADEYLSGNIKKKMLDIANSGNPNEYEKNYAALQAAMPPRVEAKDIAVKLGSHWVDSKYIRQFILEKFKPDARTESELDVSYSKAAGTWKIEGQTATAKTNHTASSKYGTHRKNAYDIIDGILNNSDLLVKDRVKDEYGNDKRDENGKYILVTNEEETKAVRHCANIIKSEFADWIFKDPDRREALVNKYNEVFNSFRYREYDGSHLNFVGMNTDITLKEHQKNAVARGLYGGNTLLAHAVGGGKTYEMIAIAMEGKRLGLHSKSLFAVPNSLTEQIGSDFRKLYPNANILVATKKDFEKNNRAVLLAKMAANDWDAVIVGHSQFDRMGLSPERESAYLNSEIAKLRDELEKIKAENPDGKRSFTVKNIEKSIESYTKKLKDLTEKQVKDDFIDFEQLGFDKIFVDECHMYKNLATATKMRNVAGLGSRGSSRAFNLLMKAKYLDGLTGGKGCIYASGTPVSNSMTELYTLMRYLQADTLKDLGIEHFDEWAADFGEVVTDYELKPEGDGKYQLKTRFAKFTNLPELMSIFKQAADIRTADTLNLEKPVSVVKEIVAKPSRIQKRGIKALGERAAEIRSGSVDPRIDNMLCVTNDGRKIGLDQRLLNPDYPDDENSKVNMCVRNVFDIYTQTADKRSTQCIFCDLSTPKTESRQDRFAVYRPNEKSDIGYEIIRKKNGIKKETYFQTIKDYINKNADEEEDKLQDGDIAVIRRPNGDNTKIISEAAIFEKGKFNTSRSDELLEKLEMSPVEDMPPKEFNIYDDIKDKLVKQGVPEKEIAFIHDYDTAEKKQELFNRMNAGEVRILLGSTSKCGAGMNCQRKMIALHHLDAPMRPSDMEQRNGRIERQGNENPEVQIYRYVTDRTFDSYLYQMLENKQKFISQVMTSKTPERVCADIDEAALDYAEVKALCAGNPLIREEMELQNKIKDLKMEKSRYSENLYEMQDKIRVKYPEEIRISEIINKHNQQDLDAANAAEFIINDEEKKVYPIEICGVKYTDRKEGGNAIKAALGANIGLIAEGKTVEIGTYRGMRLSVYQNELTRKIGACLEGQKNHYCELNPETDSGNIIRLDNCINNIAVGIRKTEEEIAAKKADLEVMKNDAEKPFPRAEELFKAETRLEEVHIELTKFELNDDSKEKDLYERLCDDFPEILSGEHSCVTYETSDDILAVTLNGSLLTFSQTYGEEFLQTAMQIDYENERAVPFSLDGREVSKEICEKNMYFSKLDKWLDKLEDNGIKKIKENIQMSHSGIEI